MALFYGSFENKVDRKGRMSVPAPFRSALASQRFNGVFCFRALYEQAIEAFSETDMEWLARSIEKFDRFDETRADLEAVFAESQPYPIDGDGRIILPRDLLDFAGIDDTALFVSAIDHFQIWSPAVYSKKKAGARERLQAKRIALPVRPFDGGGLPGADPASGR